MRHKVRLDSPGPSDPQEAAVLSLIDRREGSWTKLELIRMDRRFCAAVRQAHPESVAPEQLRQAG